LPTAANAARLAVTRARDDADIAGVVAAMRLDASDPSLQQAGCAAMRHLMSSETYTVAAAAAATAFAAGAIAHIVAVMRRHNTCDDTLSAASGVLARMASLEIRRASFEMGVAGAVEALADALRLSPSSGVLQYEACWALTLLFDLNREKALRAGVVDAAVALLGRVEAGAAPNACRLLAIIFLSNIACRDVVVHAGAVDAFMGVLKAHAGDAKVAEAACSGLLHFTRHSPQQAAEAHRRGGALLMQAVQRSPRITAKTREHAHSVELRMRECAAAAAATGDASLAAATLSEASADDPTAAAARALLVRVEQARAAGDLGGVVAAMRTGAADRGLQDKCIVALMQLTADVTPLLDPATEQDAVEAVVATLRTHGSNDVNLQGNACDVLTRLTWWSERGAVAAVDAGALEALLAVVRDTATRPQRAVLSAFFSIVRLLRAARVRASQQGAVEVLVRALLRLQLTRHEQDVELYATACAALKVLLRLY
jgi:hypothetical protein